MNQPSLIDGLFELKENNPTIKVFWSCHREPTDEIKNKFEHKVAKIWKVKNNVEIS